MPELQYMYVQIKRYGSQIVAGTAIISPNYLYIGPCENWTAAKELAKKLGGIIYPSRTLLDGATSVEEATQSYVPRRKQGTFMKRVPR